MLPLTRKGLFWLVLSLISLLALAASYLRYSRSVPVTHGGTAAGLAYGFGTLALILVLLAYGLRKRSYRLPVGTLAGWLQAHVYLGLLVAVMGALHAGFRFHDRVATASYGVLLAVVLTGVLGARLFASLPERLSRVESGLTAEQISEELNQLTEAMARLTEGRSATFAKVYQRLAGAARPKPLAGWRLVFLGAGRERAELQEGRWARALALVGDEEREALRQLLVLSRQHAELHQRLRQQQRYRNLLDAWLYLHLPLSIVLLILVLAHVVAVFYFGAVRWPTS